MKTARFRKEGPQRVGGSLKVNKEKKGRRGEHKKFHDRGNLENAGPKGGKPIRWEKTEEGK